MELFILWVVIVTNGYNGQNTSQQAAAFQTEVACEAAKIRLVRAWSSKVPIRDVLAECVGTK